jgi:phosphohistidine phosphatase
MSNEPIISDRFGQLSGLRSAAAHSKPSSRGLLGELEQPSDVFRHLGPNWYTSIMGTGIVANAAALLPVHAAALHSFALGVWVLAATLLLALTLATAVHWLWHAENARDPAMAPIYGRTSSNDSSDVQSNGRRRADPGPSPTSTGRTARRFGPWAVGGWPGNCAATGGASRDRKPARAGGPIIAPQRIAARPAVRPPSALEMPLTKRLFLLRHAKSSWDNPALSDHDRPLAARGRKASTKMAKHLHEREIRPALVLCSSAARARETLERVDPSGEIRIEDQLYAASARELLERLRGIPETVDSVMLIGHSPGIENLALDLADRSALRAAVEEKFPTAALAELTFPGPWSELRPGCAKLTSFVRPRDI